MHWSVKDKFVDTWLVFEKIYKSGRAKAIGVCNFHINYLEESAKVWSVIPAVNQIELHPRLTQKSILNYCKEKNIALESWSPLGSGKNYLLKMKH